MESKDNRLCHKSILGVSCLYLLLVCAAAHARTSVNGMSFERWYDQAFDSLRLEPAKVRQEAMLYLNAFNLDERVKRYKVHYIIAASYGLQGEIEKSIEYLIQSLKFLEPDKNTEKYFDLLVKIAKSHRNLNQKPQAFTFYEKAIEHAKQYGLPACQIDRITVDKSVSFSDAGDLDGALKILQSIPDGSCSDEFTAVKYEALGNTYAQRQDFAKAQTHYQKALALMPSTYVGLIAYIKVNFARALANDMKHDMAQIQLNEAIALNEQNEINIDGVLLDGAKGLLAFKKADYASALVYANSVLQQIKEDNVPNLRSDELFIEPYYREDISWIIDTLLIDRQFERAVSMQKHFISSLKQDLNGGLTNSIGLAEARVNAAERKGEIAFLKKQSEVTALEKQRLFLLVALLTITAILIAIISVKIYLAHAAQRERNKMLASEAQVVKSRAKKAEQSLRIKENLFNETHHRVKNNFQTVVNLLEMQHRRADPSENNGLSDVLLEASNRVKAMAAIHHQLLAQGEDTLVNIKALFLELSTQFAKQQNVHIDIDCVDHTLSADIATPLILTANELLLNASKHAFDSHGGRVSISLEALDTGSYKLVLEDNGKGLPEAFDADKASSMGLQIVNALVRQIKGRLFLDSNKSGTHWELSFNTVSS